MINFRELNSENTEFSKNFTSFLSKRTLVTKEVRNTVGDIISQMRNNGDEALKSFTKKFDNFEAEQFIVSEREINDILKDFDKSLIKSFEFSFDRLINYQSICLESLNLDGPKRDITRKFRTIDSVGMSVSYTHLTLPTILLV